MVSILSSQSVNTPKLEVSFDETNAVPSSVSSGFLCLVSTYSDNSRLHLAASIRCHTLWCQARALLLLVKFKASKLIFLSSSSPWIPGFFPSDSITLMFLNFQTGIGALPHATFETEHLILIPELLLLIPLPIYKVLMEE